MTTPIFTGVGVALITLFNDDGSLDAKASAAHAEQLVALGMKSVIVGGSTGEASALDQFERTELLSAVRDAVPISAGVPVIAGTGATSARQAVRFTRAAVDAGADGILALSPPGDADLHRYYGEIKTAGGDLPLLGYHFPNVSAPGIALGTLRELPLDGCKDSSGDVNRLFETLETWDKPLYTGSSALLALAGPLGCAGAILQLANSHPEQCVQAFAGDMAAQRELAGPHLRSKARFPYGIKQMTAERFGVSPIARIG